MKPTRIAAEIATRCVVGITAIVIIVVTLPIALLISGLKKAIQWIDLALEKLK